MRDHEPSLVIIRRTWSDGRPVTFARLQHPGSRYELTGNYAPREAATTTTGQVGELENL
jgi:GntR family histidine utilization transcriptional repressor